MCVINLETTLRLSKNVHLHLYVISVLVSTEGRKKWHRMVETHNRHRVLT